MWHPAQGDGRVGVDHPRRSGDRVEKVGVLAAGGGGDAREGGALLGGAAGGGRGGGAGGGGGAAGDADPYVGLENGGSGRKERFQLVCLG